MDIAAFQDTPVFMRDPRRISGHISWFRAWRLRRAYRRGLADGVCMRWRDRYCNSSYELRAAYQDGYFAGMAED